MLIAILYKLIFIFHIKFKTTIINIIFIFTNHFLFLVVIYNISIISIKLSKLLLNLSL